MNNQISLRMVLVITTIFAGLIACFQNLPQGMILTSLFTMLLMVIVVLALFACTFLLMLPFAHLNKYLDDKSDEGGSPFAQDRLPTQIVPPIDRVTE